MLIVMNNETLYRNISNDGKQGSGAGDIILHQHADKPRPNEYHISDFDCIPDHPELRNDVSLISVKSSDNSEIYRVFIFDKFQVNGEQLECENRFIVFIRKSGGKVPKVRLICQGSNRSIEGTDIDNKLVLDAVSKHLNDKAFTVQALEYKEQEDILNFIVFLYGKKNQTSQIFKKTGGVKRKLSGYGTNDFCDWNDTEFSLHCVQLIRKYKLNTVISLLKNQMYCTKRFNMHASFLDHNNSNERLNQKIKIFDDDFYLLVKLSIKSKSALWEFLLDRIETISEDVVIDSNEYELKGMRIPDAVIIDTESDIIEISFKGDRAMNRDYFYAQRIFQGDNVLLVSDAADAVKAKYLYKVRFVKEESIICDKCPIMINPTCEKEILEEIRGNYNGRYKETGK